MANQNQPESKQQLPGSAPSKITPLACPNCHGVLGASGSCNSCQRYDRSFPVFNRKPILGDTQFSFSEIVGMDPLKFRTLLDQIKIKGFSTAVNAFFAEPGESIRDAFFRSTFDLRRTAWKFTLAVPDDAVALDLGCGKGVTSIGLAPLCKEVVAYDSSCECIEFLQRWSNYEKLTNIHCLYGDGNEFLPFEDGAFDIVVMNGVLEWLGYGHSRSASECHERLLRDVRRILKPSGQLYVGTENRIGYHHFFSKKVDCTLFPLINYMIRILTSIFHKENRKTPYRPCTYTRDGLKKLLNKSGFSHVSFYSMFPDWRHLLQIASLNGRTRVSPIKSQRKLKALAYHVMCLPKVLRNFTPFFGVVASSTQKGNSLIQTLIKTLGLSIDLDGPLLVSKTGTVIVRARATDGKGIIVRLPYSPSGKEKCVRNAKRLRDIHDDTTVPESFKQCVPSLLAKGECKGQLATAETLLSGISLNHVREQHLNVVWRSLVRILVPWSMKDVGNAETDINLLRANVLRSWVLAVKKIIPKNHDHEVLADFLTKTEFDLNAMPEFAALTHGDCHPGNVLINKDTGEISGLIDWDVQIPSAPPFFDLLNFAIRAEHHGDPTQGLLPLRINSEWQNDLRDLVHRFNLPGGFIDYLQKFYVLWRIADRLDEPIVHPRHVDRARTLLHWFYNAQSFH